MQTADDLLQARERATSLCNKIGPALQCLRKMRYQTQKEFAQALACTLEADEVAQSYISEVENGNVNPSMPRFFAWCTALQFSPSQAVLVAQILVENPDLKPKHVLDIQKIAKEQHCVVLSSV